MDNQRTPHTQQNMHSRSSNEYNEKNKKIKMKSNSYQIKPNQGLPPSNSDKIKSTNIEEMKNCDKINHTKHKLNSDLDIFGPNDHKPKLSKKLSTKKDKKCIKKLKIKSSSHTLADKVVKSIK